MHYSVLSHLFCDETLKNKYFIQRSENFDFCKDIFYEKRKKNCESPKDKI